MKNSIFKEKQRFRDWEVYALLAFFIFGLTYKFIDGQFLHPSTDAMSVVSYLVLLTPLLAGLWYLLSLKLSVKVTDEYISLKYTPWHPKKQKIKWEDVEACEVLKTSPQAEWSGWNVSFDHEKKYTLSGGSGLHLKTKQGEDILIGVKKCEELEEVVRKVFRE